MGHKRISQLNRIIEGANNACNNDVISRSRRNSIRDYANDIIEEYEDVAYGEKKLSKVSEIKNSYTTKVGDKNRTVENIQQKLYDLGYTSQLVTGYYGDITFNNVAYFQIVNGLTVTGWVDSTTYNKLFSSSAIELEDESEGIEVKSLLEVNDIDTLKPDVIEQIQYFDELYLYSVVAEEQQIINSFEATYMKEFCEANVLQLRTQNKTMNLSGSSLEDFLIEVVFVEIVLGFFDLDLLVSYSYAATLDEVIISKLTSNANVKIIEKYIAQNLKCKYTVYELYDENDVVKYVGRTRQSLDARLKQHHYVDSAKMDLRIRVATFEDVKTADLTYSQARGLEQLVFQKHIDDGAELLNKIKPMNVDEIAKSSKLQKYLDDALEFIKKAVW